MFGDGGVVDRAEAARWQAWGGVLSLLVAISRQVPADHVLCFRHFRYRRSKLSDNKRPEKDKKVTRLQRDVAEGRQWEGCVELRDGESNGCNKHR